MGQLTIIFYSVAALLLYRTASNSDFRYVHTAAGEQYRVYSGTYTYTRRDTPLHLTTIVLTLSTPHRKLGILPEAAMIITALLNDIDKQLVT